MKKLAIALLSSLLFAATALAAIPETFTVGTIKFNTDDGFRIPVPDHPDWQWSMYRQGAIMMTGWYNLSFDQEKPVQLDVFNGTLGQPGPKLKWSMDGGITFETYSLSSQSGYSWTNDEWLASLATATENKFDYWFLKQHDPLVTKSTGSSNMRFYSSDELLAYKYGISPTVLDFYERYRRQQVKRPRWWLLPFGMPVGIYFPKDTLPNFGEWDENEVGMNGYDLQHLDAYELYTGYNLTKSPAYLFSMINLWVHAEAHGWYIQQVEGQNYGGASRTLGWYLVTSCQLYSMIKDLPSFGWLRERVIESITWHVDNGISLHPISSIPWYGAVPQMFKEYNKNYVFGWHYAICAHGYFWVAKTFDDDLGERAGQHGLQIVDYIASHSLEGPPASGGSWVAYIWAVDETPEFLILGHPPGVALWNLVPLMKTEPGEYPLRDSLIKWMQGEGWMNEDHKYFTVALDMMGKEIWNL